MIYRLGLLIGCLAALAVVGGTAGVALHRSQGKALHKGGKVCPRVEVDDLCLCGPHRVVLAERADKAASEWPLKGRFTRVHSSRVNLAGQEFMSNVEVGRRPDGTVVAVFGLQPLPASAASTVKKDLPPHGSRPLDPSRTQAVVDAYIRAAKAARP